MKKTLGGLVISALLAAPAMAADIRRACRSRPRRRRLSPCSAGLAATSAATSATPGARRKSRLWCRSWASSYDHDLDGFVAGGQVGCNLWQRDRWVFGIEGQASWADMDGSVEPSTTAVDHNGFRTDADVIGSIAARLGYAFGATGQTLVFVKGGAAFIHEQFFGNTGLRPKPGRSTSDKDLRWGWMVGAVSSRRSTATGRSRPSTTSATSAMTTSGSVTWPVCFDFERQAARPPGQGRHQLPLRRFGGPVVARY